MHIHAIHIVIFRNPVIQLRCLDSDFFSFFFNGRKIGVVFSARISLKAVRILWKTTRALPLNKYTGKLGYLPSDSKQAMESEF